ncbi:uncharacterized protein LOC142227494 [Haematobia irritans]|uniref:uncharacterized protein LOC142227494 n=2 Tax=Haematobia irritans TaxID=7368 RepID=UPI003F502BE4
MIVAEEHTLQQLKLYCEKLNLPSNGTKATLVSRLNNIPSGELQICIDAINETTKTQKGVVDPKSVTLVVEELQTCIDANNEATKNQQTLIDLDTVTLVAEYENKAVRNNKESSTQQQVDTDDEKSSKEIRDKVAYNNDDNELKSQTEKGDRTELKSDANLREKNMNLEESNGNIMHNGNVNNVNERVYNEQNNDGNETMQRLNEAVGNDINLGLTDDKEKQLLLRELNILKKERDLLIRENVLLNKTRSPIMGRNEVDIPLTTLKELLPQCSGGPEFKTLFAQLNSIRNTYDVSEKNLRALICSKLEGNAKDWLYSKPHYLDLSVDDLMQQMKDMFDVKENRIIARRNFEDRKWKYNEKFVDYFNAKVILSNPLRMQDDELLEYLVEGISSLQLRTQAKLQNYKSKEDFFQTFKNIEQQPRQSLSRSQAENTTGTSKGSTPMKCFNCNCSGHIAAECRKPRRETGSCYACGQFGHMAKDCSQYKKSVLNKPQTNEYNVS